MSLPETQKVVLFDAISETWETIKYVDYPTPQIESDQDVIIKNQYAGINFIETYFRKGIYPTEVPAIFGREASGVVVAIGDKVTRFKVGDKVAYISPKTFAQYTKINESQPQVIKLLDSTSEEHLKIYGSILIQGLTARTFIDEAFKVEPGHFVLIWAAAGGVGQILVQLVKQRGAHPIAIASTKEKLDIAHSLGAEYLINSTSDDILDKVHEITNGQGVDVSFDSVGKDSFEISLSAIKRKGSLISYGNSSGPVPPFPIARLSAKNIKIARPTLFNYITTRDEFEHYSQDLINLVESNKLKFDITKTYDLKDYSQATQDLESRKTTGKLSLKIPQ